MHKDSERSCPTRESAVGVLRLWRGEFRDPRFLNTTAHRKGRRGRTSGVSSAMTRNGQFHPSGHEQLCRFVRSTPCGAARLPISVLVTSTGAKRPFASNAQNEVDTNDTLCSTKWVKQSCVISRRRGCDVLAGISL